jgi:hypothetical protein
MSGLARIEVLQKRDDRGSFILDIYLSAKPMLFEDHHTRAYPTGFQTYFHK